MKFYFAGKIGKLDWRHSIVEGLNGAGDGPGDVLGGGEIVCLPEDWPTLEGAVLIQHDYVGPFFLSGYDYNHSTSMSTHGPNRHGNAILETSSGAASHGAVDPETFRFMESNHWAVTDDETRQHIIKLCFQAIRRADVVFAWMDSMTAYGTLVELGFACAFRKPIWWAEPHGNPYHPPYDRPTTNDLWFAMHLASRHTRAPNALCALQDFLNPRWSQSEGYVYLLRSGGFIKIGKSKNVDNRITQISPKTPMPVELIHVIQSNNMSWAEALLHRRYARLRTNGEWFKLPEEEIENLLKVTHLIEPKNG